MHDILPYRRKLLLGHMVSLLHIPCFHFLMLKPRSARLSILFIVIRITPTSNTDTRRALHFLAWTFGVAWGILAVQVFWVCETQRKATWKVRDFVIFNARSLTAASDDTSTSVSAWASSCHRPTHQYGLRSQLPASSLF